MLLIFILHIPFLSADPDMQLSFSRDAHSDEGLNTSQVRNFVNHGELDMMECNNMIKSPAFNVYLYVPFSLFGTGLPVARLSIMIFCFLALFLLPGKKQMETPLLLFFLCGLTQYHLFQYMHYSLAEMPASFCMLISLAFTFLFFTGNTYKKGTLLIAVGFGLLAMCFKIQFAYLLLFVPLVSGLVTVIHFIKNDVRKLESLKYTLLAVCAVLVGLLLYYLGWYLPNKEAFVFHITDATSSRFAINDTWIHVKENLDAYTGDIRTWPMIGAFLLSLVLGIYFMIKNRFTPSTWLIMVSLVWVLLESHKLLILYVPARYMLSFFFAVCWFISVVFAFAFHSWKNALKPSAVLYYCLFAVSALLLVVQLYTYTSVLKRREYHIREACDYISSLHLEGRTAVGPWAPAITWGTHMRIYPVWKDFLNDKDIVNRFHPALIVSEPGEGCSDGAFKNDGIRLGEDFPLIREMSIGRWVIHIYSEKKAYGSK